MQQMTNSNELRGARAPEQAPREAREAFYAAAVIGLRVLDAREREPRRFGADASGRWEQFRGSLGPADRIDVLLRDATVTWGVAFSPALAFRLFGLADDEPFGPDWRGLSDDRAKRLLADTANVASAAKSADTGKSADTAQSANADLTGAARELGVKALAVPLPPISASTRLIVAGGAAILAVAEAFNAKPSLSWTDQVVVAAVKPSHRQLAGLAAVILNARGRAAVVVPGEDPAAILRAVSFAQVDAAVISADAEPEAAQFAERAKGGR